MDKFATLGYIRDGNKVLLGKKKYGGAKGKLNGFGGKVEEKDKTMKDALTREIKEETDLVVQEANLRGTLVFPSENGNAVIHVYDINDFKGSPKESDEMSVNWYEYDEINIQEMWPNDQVWFHLLNLPFNFIVFFRGPKVNDYDTNIQITLVEDIDEKTYGKFL